MFVQENDCEGLDALHWVPAVDNHRSVYHNPEGDFYREDDDVMRGITISWSDLPSEGFDPLQVEQTDRKKGCAQTEVEHRDGDAANLMFHESDLPPMLPPESHHVEANTVYLDSIKDPYWKVGNRLLHFLREKAVSEIRKVNKKKYTVKAKVLCSGLVCEIKVRAYRTEKTEMALVVHRLGGDSIAFNALFRLLKQDLTSEFLRSELEDGHLDVSPDLPDEVENFVDRQSSTVDPAEGFLTPLFDAAHNAEDTQAQAEAAASLAAAAEDTSTVKQLCSQKAQKAIVKLLQVNCFEVSCQVVRLIVKLAVTPGAEVFFSGEGLLGLLQRKVKDLPVGRMLQDQLSQTVEMLRGGSKRVLCQ